MKLFPEQKDKRRLAVTAGLLLLAAVLLFAAEALLDNLHGRPSGETESIGIDALTLSAQKPKTAASRCPARAAPCSTSVRPTSATSRFPFTRPRTASAVCAYP